MRKHNEKNPSSMERQDTEPCMDPNEFALIQSELGSFNNEMIPDFGNFTSGTLFDESITGFVPSSSTGQCETQLPPQQVFTTGTFTVPASRISISQLSAALDRVQSDGGGTSQPRGYGVQSGITFVATRAAALQHPAETLQEAGAIHFQKQVEVLKNAPMGGLEYVNNHQLPAVSKNPHANTVAGPSSSSAVTSISAGSDMPPSPATLAVTHMVEDMDVMNYNSANQYHQPGVIFSSEPKFNPNAAAIKKELVYGSADLSRADSIDVMQLSDWPGKLNFCISFPADTRNNRKWSYLDTTKKVFCQPNIAIEVHVRVSSWQALEGTGATVRLCPVYTEAHHRTTPVMRCPHHAKADPPTSEHAEYLIQIDSRNAVYGSVGNRQIVSAPLQASHIGEEFATLLVKCSCMTSCVGGPNRRPFAIIFSLMIGGKEEGRYVLDIKCCKGVFRDMKAEKIKQQIVEAQPPSTEPPSPLPAVVHQKNTYEVTLNLEGKKRKSVRETPGLTSNSDSERRSSKKIKVNSRPSPMQGPVCPSPPPGYCNIVVPLQYKERVIDYLKALKAYDLLKEKYPEDARQLDL